MPQTIALQRGTTTVTTNGETQATLFTQSGGIATRVIPNAIGVFFSNPQPQASVLLCGIYCTISGGQTLLVGYMHLGSGFYARSFQFPISSIPNTGPSNGVWNSNNTIVSSTNPTITNNATLGIGDLSITSLSINYPLGNNPRMAMLPSSFYIGPSDIIRIRVYGLAQSGKSQIPTTANITYSFTTITETA
jgi:hypothetical protein